jgi:hypothetical protein
MPVIRFSPWFIVEGKGEIAMRKTLLLTITALLFIACNIEKKGTKLTRKEK